MPVYMNEPISMLQRFGEMWEYKDLLKSANNEPNEYKRMGYVIAFTFMNLAQSVGRNKKPFNPLLGETFEYINEDIQTVSEQVCHHPPISATYAVSPDFEVSCFMEPKSKLTLTKLEVSPRSVTMITLKKTGETFYMDRPKSSVHGILTGNVYVWHYGDLVCRNSTTKSEARIVLKNLSMFGGKDYNCEGVIKNANGRFLFYLGFFVETISNIL